MVNDSWNYHWVTSTIITVWTGLYTWHYIISIFFFCVLSLGRESGMISGPAVLKSLWNDLDVVIGQLKWVWQPKCIFQYCQPQLGCWELKSNADLLCEIWVCWQVLIRVVVKIKAAVWNIKWGSSKLALCMHQETWPVNQIFVPVFLQGFEWVAFTKWWTQVMERNHDIWELKTMFYFHYYICGFVTNTQVS